MANNTKLICEHVRWVEMLTHRFCRARGMYDYREDIFQDGCLGLVLAARRYDPSRGFLFRIFAEHRVVGAIRDGLRRKDHLSRSMRQEAKRTRSEVTFIYLDHISSAKDDKPLNQVIPFVDPTSRLIEKIDTQREIRKLKKCVEALPHRERKVILAIHFEGLTQREVALRMGVTDGYISQIYKKGIKLLKVRRREI